MLLTMLVVTLWVSMGLKPKVTVHMMTVMVFLIPMVVLKIMRGMKTTMKGPGLASAGFAVDEHDDDAACDDAVGDTSETLMRLKLMFIMHRMAIVRAAPVTKEVTLIRVMLVIFGTDDALRRDDDC